MTSSAVSMELSVSFVSWINDQMRDEVQSSVVRKRVSSQVNFLRTFVVAGVACISFALASIIAT